MPLVRFLRLVLRSLQRAAQRADLVVEIADLGVEIVGAAAPAAPSWSGLGLRLGLGLGLGLGVGLGLGIG